MGTSSDRYRSERKKSILSKPSTRQKKEKKKRKKKQKSKINANSHHKHKYGEYTVRKINNNWRFGNRKNSDKLSERNRNEINLCMCNSVTTYTSGTRPNKSNRKNTPQYNPDSTQIRNKNVYFVNSVWKLLLRKESER